MRNPDEVVQTSNISRRNKAQSYYQYQESSPVDSEVHEYVSFAATGHDSRFVEPTPYFEQSGIVKKRSPEAHLKREKNNEYSTELSWREQDCCSKMFYFCLLFWCCCCYHDGESAEHLLLEIHPQSYELMARKKQKKRKFNKHSSENSVSFHQHRQQQHNHHVPQTQNKHQSHQQKQQHQQKNQIQYSFPKTEYHNKEKDYASNTQLEDFVQSKNIKHESQVQPVDNCFTNDLRGLAKRVETVNENRHAILSKLDDIHKSLDDKPRHIRAEQLPNISPHHDVVRFSKTDFEQTDQGPIYNTQDKEQYDHSRSRTPGYFTKNKTQNTVKELVETSVSLALSKEGVSTFQPSRVNQYELLTNIELRKLKKKQRKKRFMSNAAASKPNSIRKTTIKKNERHNVVVAPHSTESEIHKGSFKIQNLHNKFDNEIRENNNRNNGHDKIHKKQIRHEITAREESDDDGSSEDIQQLIKNEIHLRDEHKANIYERYNSFHNDEEKHSSPKLSFPQKNYGHENNSQYQYINNKLKHPDLHTNFK